MAKYAQHNAVNWFEIPVRNLDRAQAFYEQLLGCTLQRQAMGPHALAVFPYDGGGVGGCLMTGDALPAPGQQGVMVYLNAQPSLDAALARVQAAGGRIATPRVDLPGDMGSFAHVDDPEGNRIGLHAAG